MGVRVVRVGHTPAVTVVSIGGVSVTGAVLITPVGAGARSLDELDDVSGAAAGTTGQVLTRQSDGQYRPADPPLAGSVGRIELTGAAGQTLSGHRAVTRGVDGTLIYAGNDDPAFLHTPVWITTGAASAGSVVEVVAYGLLIEPSWSWAPGPIYLGVGGSLTQTPPTAPGAAFLAQVGVATSATSVFVDRQQSIILV